mmetsp:Transcript_11424/g.21843  ORF Transcript_11424/g.21843 Transcript_11424/m.21843 type:complete len:83 (-) Transcript_11424:253-501(-)|eukprot:scaffold15_cov204-Amphora_coffeaeformis.AAC.15
MGCNSSKDNALANVDDSVHVMIAHDKKRAIQKGEAPHGYVPRAPHPLLEKKKVEVEEAGETKTSQDDNIKTRDDGKPGASAE